MTFHYLLSYLGQTGCIEFLSEPWSHSVVAFSDQETLARQTQLYDEMIKSMFVLSPEVFIIHSPVCPEKTRKSLFEQSGKGIFMYSNHIGKAPIKQTATNKTSLSNKGVFLIKYALSQTLQDLDSNPDKQIRIYFASRIFSKLKNNAHSPEPQILIYNREIKFKRCDN